MRGEGAEGEEACGGSGPVGQAQRVMEAVEGWETGSQMGRQLWGRPGREGGGLRPLRGLMCHTGHKAQGPQAAGDGSVSPLLLAACTEQAGCPQAAGHYPRLSGHSAGAQDFSLRTHRFLCQDPTFAVLASPRPAPVTGPSCCYGVYLSSPQTEARVAVLGLSISPYF